MPAFLEKKLRAEYGNNPRAIYGTMNKIGAMHGNQETAKGREMEKKHMAKPKFHMTHITHHDDGSHSVEHVPQMKRKSAGFMEHGEATSYSAENGEKLLDKLHDHLGIGAEEKEAGGEGDGGEME